MLYDIYFHNDFDGRASSAVMLAFLRSRGDDIEHFVPLKYDIIPQWLDEKFLMKHKLFKGKHNPAIIVDFPYHPQTTFWFEHHPTTFKKPSWEKNFKPTKYLHYEPKYKSACHVVYDALWRDFGWKPPAHLKELVKWLDIIDGANYKSAKQTIEMKEPALQVCAFIDREEQKKNGTTNERWIISLLAEKSLSDIARVPKVSKVFKDVRRKVAAGLAFYKKNMKMFGKTAFIDLSAKKFEGVRFASYYLKPKLAYIVRLTKDNIYHLGVGANPWLPLDKKIHIGELLRGYGGGGHKGVGGVEFTSKKEAMRAIGEIIIFLNKH